MYAATERKSPADPACAGFERPFAPFISEKETPKPPQQAHVRPANLALSATLHAKVRSADSEIEDDIDRMIEQDVSREKALP